MGRADETNTRSRAPCTHYDHQGRLARIYADALRQILALPGSLETVGSGAPREVSVGELLARHVQCSFGDGMARLLREQAGELRRLAGELGERCSAPGDPSPPGVEWAGRTESVARRLELIAWLHDRVLESLP